MAKKPGESAIVVASTEEASKFIRKLQRKFPGKRTAPADRKVRKYLAKFDVETLRRVFRRALINLVQHPAQAAKRRKPRKSGKS
jgi:hypothetical protein